MTSPRVHLVYPATCIVSEIYSIVAKIVCNLPNHMIIVVTVTIFSQIVRMARVL